MTAKQFGHHDQDQHAGTPQHSTAQHSPEHALLASSSQQQAPQAGAVPFTDLPQPFFKALVGELGPHCYTLFRSCRALAAAVAHHSTHLSLTPASTLLRDSNQRRFVLELAANCNHIGLKLQQQSIPLDVAAVWPCIKQLTFDRVSFTPTTISNLHLEQLKELHTIAVTRKWVTPPNYTLNVSALRRLVQLGALPNLRTLTCMGMTRREAIKVLQQLSVVMGQRVTELVLDHVTALKVIKLWPALQRVQVQPVLPPFKPLTTSIQHMFDHPHLKEVVVPSDMFYMLGHINVNAKRLEALHLSDVSGVLVESLLQIPLQGVQRLRFHARVHAQGPVSTAAVQHLCQCPQIEFLPGTWQDYSTLLRLRLPPLPSDTPTWQLGCDPALVEWVLPHLSKAEGALILCGDPHSRQQVPLGKAPSNSLCLLPPGIHTLALDNCDMGHGLTWAQLVAQLPQHVHCLLLRRCGITQPQFEAVLAKPPPAGLSTMSLAYDSKFMPWVQEHADALRGLVATNWPGVKLFLYIDECLEDFLERRNSYMLQEWFHDCLMRGVLYLGDTS